jgi:hypothetical protein
MLSGRLPALAAADGSGNMPDMVAAIERALAPADSAAAASPNAASSASGSPLRARPGGAPGAAAAGSRQSIAASLAAMERQLSAVSLDSVGSGFAALRRLGARGTSLDADVDAHAVLGQALGLDPHHGWLHAIAPRLRPRPRKRAPAAGRPPGTPLLSQASMLGGGGGGAGGWEALGGAVPPGGWQRLLARGGGAASVVGQAHLCGARLGKWFDRRLLQARGNDLTASCCRPGEMV